MILVDTLMLLNMHLSVVSKSLCIYYWGLYQPVIMHAYMLIISEHNHEVSWHIASL